MTEMEIKAAEKLLLKRTEELAQEGARLKKERYEFYNIPFKMAYKRNYITASCTPAYWTELIENAYSAGEEIGKSRIDVQLDYGIYFVDIYCHYQMYKEAHEVYLNLAQYAETIDPHYLSEIVKGSGRWMKLRNVIADRSKENDSFLSAYEILIAMGY